MSAVVKGDDVEAAHGALRKRRNLDHWPGCFDRHIKDCRMLAQAIADAREAGEARGLAEAERSDWRKAIAIHFAAANEWRLRFVRLVKAFGLEWETGRDVDSFLDDAIAARRGGAR